MLSREFKENAKKEKELNLVGPLAFTGSPRLNLSTFLIDGGADNCHHFLHSVKIGDGDSSKRTMDIKFSTNKNFSDFAGALSCLESEDLGIQKIHCWGLIGGRKDHEWSNLLEAYRFCQKNIWEQIIFYDSNDKKIIVLRQGNYELSHSGPFSLFSFEDTKIDLSGHCAYSYDFNSVFPRCSSQGLSNVGSGKFNLKTSGALVCFYE